jgi:hypothetical protein
MEREAIGRQVARIHSGLPVVDGHNDLPWAIRVRGSGDLSQVDASQFLEGFHTDGPRLASGGVGAQFWSVFVPGWETDPFDAVNVQIDLVEAMIRNDHSIYEAQPAPQRQPRSRERGGRLRLLAQRVVTRSRTISESYALWVNWRQIHDTDTWGFDRLGRFCDGCRPQRGPHLIRARRCSCDERHRHDRRHLARFR